MPVSGIGVIESGIDGITRPTLIPTRYSQKTDIYNIPYISDDIISARGEEAVSAKEYKNKDNILENQLIGISRTHSPYASDGFIAFNGVFFDKSNHGANNLIVSVSGIEAYCNNVYIGGKTTEYAWSGLSHNQANYLWLSVEEQDTNIIDYLSSRRFREFSTRSTTTPDKPVGPEGSVLAATYLSGVGINTISWYKAPFTLPIDHVSVNQNPHGTKLFQDYMMTSGIDVLNASIWNSAVGSGLTLNSGTRFYNVTYLNDLVQQGTFICSGILGNVLSGNLSGTLFSQNLFNMEADPANVGYLIVASGLNVSGSLFRQSMNVNSGISVDTVDLTTLLPLSTGLCLSGSSVSGVPIHKHFFGGTPTYYNVIEPKYPGGILTPINSIGNRADRNFDYNTDFGDFRPTLRCKGISDANIYLRQYMPYGYNNLESIEITNKIDAGSTPITVDIRDCVGNLVSPRQGNVLTSSGTMVTTVSGFSQAGFSQLMPFDLEITAPATSGKSCYFGTIKTNFLTTRA